MGNMFEGLKVYAGKWQLKSERPFNADEKRFISRAIVVMSQYGKSVQFDLAGTGGGCVYIPLEPDSVSLLNVGDVVSMDKLTLVVLTKSGEGDINRIRYNK